jgi:hypothetical protein
MTDPTPQLVVLIAIALALILFCGSEQAVVSSVMEDDDPAKQIQADTVLKIYERILHSERYSNSTFAMKEARRLCRLKE